MKVTNENIDTIEYIADSKFNLSISKEILKSLLIDLRELNDLLVDKDESYRQVYIDYEDIHMQYSCERTDPCPDYYGYFSLRFEKDHYETIGDYMNLSELENSIFILTNFIEFKLS